MDKTDDIVLLLGALSAIANEQVVAAMAAAGFADVRASHGFVFQHLVPGPQTVGELAQRLGITAQGASKAVVELEALGYVRRVVDPQDRRSRVVELTERGQAAIEAARRVRSAVNVRLRDILGERAAGFAADLRHLAESSGAWDALWGRRLRPPQ